MPDGTHSASVAPSFRSWLNGRIDRQRLPDHDSMTVCGQQTEFTHAPWLVSQRLDERGARIDDLLADAVDVVDDQVGEIRVVAERARWHGVGTVAGQDTTAVAHEHAPAG